MAASILQHKASGKIIAGMILTILLFVLTAVLPRQINSITGLHVAPQTMLLISRIAFWICLLLVFFYCTKIEQMPLSLWPDKKRGVAFYFLSVPLILLIVLIGTVLISLAIKLSGLSGNSKIAQSLASYGLALKMLTIVTAAIVEELVFRGYLLSRLQLFFDKGFWPIVLSALLFGLAHMGYGTFINVIIPVFIGLIFAWHYHKYHNIKVIIICHFLIDFYALVVQ